MTNQPKCRGTRDDGNPCQSRFVNAESGYCPAHGPGGRERMSEMGKKGGAFSSPRKGFIRGLPPLKEAADAEFWLEAIGRAVLEGHMEAKEANVARQIVNDWRRFHEEDRTNKQIADLEKSIASFRRKIESE